MNNKKKEGSFYASKVRLFLNEYGGENLQEFCNAENVSYTKMCHCLGRPAYRKPKVTSAPPRGQESDGSDALLPVIDLQPLVVDMPNHSTDSSSSCKCPKFEVIANLEVESVVNTFAVIIHLKLSHYGNDRLRKRV